MKTLPLPVQLVLAGSLSVCPTLAQGGGCPNTVRVSVDSAGGQSNYYSLSTDISGNGRHIALGSFATNLVPGLETVGIGSTLHLQRGKCFREGHSHGRSLLRNPRLGQCGLPAR